MQVILIYLIYNILKEIEYDSFTIPRSKIDHLKMPLAFVQFKDEEKARKALETKIEYKHTTRDGECNIRQAYFEKPREKKQSVHFVNKKD